MDEAAESTEFISARAPDRKESFTAGVHRYSEPDRCMTEGDCEADREYYEAPKANLALPLPIPIPIPNPPSP